jgi:hypothetical protein
MELLHDCTYAGHRGAAGRERLAPLAVELLRRAQAQGSARPDLEPSDLPVLQVMVMPFADATRDGPPGLWRRMLAVVLDGMRARPDTDGALPCAAPAEPVAPRDGGSSQPQSMPSVRDQTVHRASATTAGSAAGSRPSVSMR